MSPLPGLTLPRYRKAALCDLLPSAASAVGVPGFDNVLGFPQVKHVCVLLVDGLGAKQLAQQSQDAPFLAGLASHGGFTAGFPSTTSTSLTSLSTGLTPAEHGMLGYQMRIPGTDNLLHSLKWHADVDPMGWQPYPSVFEHTVEAGVPGYHVASSAFVGRGLTLVAWRGAREAPADTPGDVIGQAASALRQDERSIVVAYTADLDRTGHQRGWQSHSWQHQLSIVDYMTQRLADSLPPQTLLLVTGDHGMVDVHPSRRLNIDVAAADFDPEAIGHSGPVSDADRRRAAQLSENIVLFSGEDRVRYLHVRPGSMDDVVHTWRELLGEQAWIFTREQAIEENWYGGAIRPEHRERIGDIIVAAGPGLAVGASVREPRKYALPIGLHGSLTEDEQHIPLLMVQA